MDRTSIVDANITLDQLGNQDRDLILYRFHNNATAVIKGSPPKGLAGKGYLADSRLPSRVSRKSTRGLVFLRVV